MSKLILQTFHHFTYITTHSPTLPSLYLRHSLFSNPSVASPISQPIIQPFFRFSTSQAHSPTIPSLCLRHRLYSNPSVALPTSQLILRPFRRFAYVTVHSQTLLSLHFFHVTSSSLSSPGELPMLNHEILQPVLPLRSYYEIV